MGVALGLVGVALGLMGVVLGLVDCGVLRHGNEGMVLRWVWSWWAGDMVMKKVIVRQIQISVVLIDVLFCQLRVLVTNT